MNTNSALHIARKSAILLAALCSVSIAASAFAGAPIRGSVVKGGCNCNCKTGCPVTAARTDSDTTDPNDPQPTAQQDMAADGTGATPAPAENVNPIGGIGVVVKRDADDAPPASQRSDSFTWKCAVRSKETGCNNGRVDANPQPITEPSSGADGDSASAPAIHDMAINEKGTPGTKSNTTKKGNARTASGESDDGDADGDTASGAVERHDVHVIKWNGTNVARCAVGQTDSNALTPTDPKDPKCLLKTRTKSNSTNE